MFNVSAIIVTYKRRKKLQQAINSVLNQSYKPKELIVVNNNSYPIKLKKKIVGINIRVINCFKNFKSVNGRNLGVNFSKGNFLAFLDDDDTWDIDYLRTVKKKYYQNKYDVFVSKMHYYNQKNKLYKQFVREKNNLILDKVFTINTGFATSNIIINKNIFKKVGGYDDKAIPAEDRVLLIELILNKIKICSTDAKIYYRLGKKHHSLSTNYAETLKGHSYILEKYRKIIPLKNKLFIKYKIYRAHYEVKKNFVGVIYFLIGLVNLFIFNLIK